ncbi:RNA polymerase sigma factor [Mesonia aestuariivivens]|uniref:RNA polymerase sigma factor n=1 Tax=Mesonia aestuariivivens TaxID=2796128 RepID=A0ABS6W3M7_9FLAO|nr:RNA polymerase sigma factor [Mesonia aestuariivivens]MBW2962468.1 RNA polymerase sigma factor [Mesonia aestuariivivens]
MRFIPKDRISAEDIVQQSFIKLWGKRKELPSDTIISAFLFTVSRNLFIDIYRKERRKISISDEIHLEAVLDGESESSETLNIRRQKLKIAVENLPAKCKEVFKLRQKDNLKIKKLPYFQVFLKKLLKIICQEHYDCLGSNF